MYTGAFHISKIPPQASGERPNSLWESAQYMREEQENQKYCARRASTIYIHIGPHLAKFVCAAPACVQWSGKTAVCQSGYVLVALDEI